MADTAELKHMVMSFRVSELQVLLGYIGRSRTGRKHELMTTALQVLKSGCSAAVQIKIRELYQVIIRKRRYPGKAMSPSEFATVVDSSPPPRPQTLSSPTALLYHHSASSSQPPAAKIPPAASGPIPLLSVRAKQDADMSHRSPPRLPAPPDVRLTKLPFYDVLDEIMKPTGLVATSTQRMQEAYFVFPLTPQQVSQISSSRELLPGSRYDYSVQLQLRFCLSETSCPQEDHFPLNVCVKVNGKPCPLPGCLPPQKNGVEPKRPSRAVNMTSLVRLTPSVPNHITVSWSTDFGRSYSLAVHLVKQLSSAVLLNRLKAKGIRNSDHSRALIKEKLTADPDSEIATTSLRVSLLCPLGKMRLSLPCRALTCTHLQCFDAALYLQMNEKKPTWVCPVCDKKAPYDGLIIDGLFVEILNSCTDADEIQFRQDGLWSPMKPKKESKERTVATMHRSNADSMGGYGSSGYSALAASQPSRVGSKRAEVIDLTVGSSDDSSDASERDDDDDDDDDSSPSPPPPPPTKKFCTSAIMELPGKGVLNLHRSSVSPMVSSYLPTSLADFTSYSMSTMPPDMPTLDLYSILQTDSQFGSGVYLDNPSSNAAALTTSTMTSTTSSRLQEPHPPSTAATVAARAYPDVISLD
ncbi:E3 SUMO-protein ligase PIAS2-like isoform X2 [Lampetra fluviatilis]